MIPADLSSRLRLIQDSQIQAPTAAADIPAELPAFITGQRISARITAVQGNGVFRAEVDGKILNLTVASNNPGKPVEQLRGIGPGQTLDLVVTGKSGRNILTRLPDQTAADTPVLSRSAQIIGSLLSRGTPEAAPLAKGAPLMQATSSDAFRALPQQLRQAVSESGLFYESHQAQWVTGQLPTATLLREPQGAFSPILSTPAAATLATANATTVSTSQAPPEAPLAAIPDAEPPVALAQASPGRMPLPGTAQTTGHAPLVPAGEGAAALLSADPSSLAALPLRLVQGALFYQVEQNRWNSDLPPSPPDAGSQNGANDVSSRKPPDRASAAHPQAVLNPPSPEQAQAQAGTRRVQDGQAAMPHVLPASNPGAGPLPGELQPLVQQQLDAADSRQLYWQGQIWQGQEMEWRIEQDQSQRENGDENDQQQWKTTLRLTLPNLGQLNASLTLNPSGIALTLATDRSEALRQATPELASSLEAAGVPVLSLSVVPNEPT